MDEELKAMLDEARHAGASEAQLQNMIDLYKKKSVNGSVVATPENSPALFQSSNSDAGNGSSSLDGVPTDIASINKQTADVIKNAGHGTDNSGFRTIDPNALPDIINPNEQADKDIIKNTPAPDPGKINPVTIAGAVDKAFAIVPKALGFLSSVADQVNTWDIPNDVLAKHPEYRVSPITHALNWATDYMNYLGDSQPLPNTFVGKTIQTITGAAPLMAGGEMVKGADLLGEGTELAGNYLSKLDIFQGAVTKAGGPLTQYMATSGALSNADDAYKASGHKFVPTIEGAMQGFNEGVMGGATLELQMAAGGKIGGKLFEQMVKSGVANEDGTLTEQALKSFVGSPSAFAAGSVATDLANGRPIDWKNAGVSAFTAIPFEAPHVFEAYNQGADINANKKSLDSRINQVIAIRDNNSIFNFANAQPGEILEAMQQPQSSQELQIQALQKGIEAQNSTDYREKNSLHSQQLDLQNQADIKRIGETVINNGISGFATAVNATELPDEVKTDLLNKAKAVNNVFNPVELKKTEIGKTVEDINTQIQQLHASIPDAIPSGDSLVQLNELIGKRVASQNELFNVSYGDNELQKKGVDLANKILENPVTDPSKIIPPTNAVPVDNPLLDNGHITDVLPNGDVHLTQNDGSTERIPEGNAQTDIGITPEHKEQFIQDNLPDNKAANPSVEETGKKAIPLNNGIIKDAHIIDVHNNGDVTVREKDGSTDVVKANARKGLGITDDLVKQFRDANSIAVPKPEPINMERIDGESEFQHKLRTTTDPNELASMYNDKINDLQNNMGVDGAIADYHATMRPDEFHEHNDRANVNRSIAVNYFSKKGEHGIPVDRQAMEINDLHFNGTETVTPHEIAEFMIKYPAGHASYFTPAGNAELKAINERYREVTGKNLRKDIARKLADRFNVPYSIAAGDVAIIDSPRNHELLERKVNDLVHTSGMFTGLPDYDKVQNEFSEYVKDPSDMFNIWYDVFAGKAPNEHEIEITKNLIDEDRNEQTGHREAEGSPAKSKDSIKEPENQGSGNAGVKTSDTEPQRVSDEYDQRISELDDRIEKAKNAIKKAEGNINDANDLFASAGSTDDGKKSDALFKEGADVSEENLDRILKPLHDQVAKLENDRVDLLDEKEKAIEQAARQTQFDSEAASLGQDGKEKITPEIQDRVKTAMTNLFPNIETRYYTNVTDFNRAAEGTPYADVIKEGKDLHAFVDKDRVIHFNPEFMTKDTQLHEQGHILSNWAYHYAPKLYDRMMDAGRQMGDIQKELSKNGYDLKGKGLYEEAFVTSLARDGAGDLDKAIKENSQRGSIQRLIHEAWTKFERWIAGKTGFSLSQFKNVKDMPLGEFTKYMNDKFLLSDTKISDISSDELAGKNKDQGENAQITTAKPEREPGEPLGEYAQRVSDWMDSVGKDDVPPSDEVHPEEKVGYNFSETSIKNRVTADERRQRGLEEVEVLAKRDFGQVFENGKQMVIDGRIDPAVLAVNIIKRPRPLIAEESAALLYDRMRLYNDHDITANNIMDAMESGNRGAETEERTRLAYIEDKIELNDKAARMAGYEQGLGLAARKMMIARDYSLANQLQLAKIANGGRELPADIRLKLEGLSRQLSEANKRLAEYENDASKRESVKSLARMQKEVEIEQRTAKKQGRKKSIEQIEQRISDRKKAIYEKLFQSKKATSSIFPYADRLVEITPDLVLLAKDYIHKGIKSVDGIVDQIHEDIKDHLEGITKRDIRDAISGYGKTAKPNTDEIDIQLREIKRQARLISALEDAEQGERPLKSGYQREAPSDQVRELQRQVKQVMRENGIEMEHKTISAEDGWKSALEAVKTRLKNQISDLNKQLETGEKEPKKPGIQYDQEANDLKAERDRLQAAIEEIHGKPELSDEQKIAIAKAATEKSIAEYERRIAENDLNPERKKSNTPETPELKGLRDRLQTLKDNYKQLQDDAKPKRTPDELALAALKKRLEDKTADLQNRLQRGDFEPKPKKPPVIYDDEAKRLQANVNKIQRKFDEEREKIRLANRTKLEKRLDWFAKYRRFVLLSNPTTVAKLTAAGAMRMITSPLEEVTGHVVNVIPGVSKIAAMAPREGSGFDITSEARSLAEVLSRRSINEMIRTLREGKSELDERVDEKEKTYREHGVLELPGQIHAALKTIPKQNEYYRSLQKRIDFALRNGYDITTPDVQTALQVQAYKDANPELFTGKAVAMSDLEHRAFNDGRRAIFMQDNLLSDSWQGMIKGWERAGPKGEVAATIARVFLPIIKIPTNFVAETSSYAFGGVKAMLALSKGIENLTPDDADYILRAMKKQGVGIGFFALGYLSPGAIGGFFVDGEKRKKHGPAQGDMLLFGHSVPHWLMHAPVLEVLQMGATVRHIHDQWEHNKKVSGFNEVEKGSLAIGKGLIGQVPLFGEPADIAAAGENVKTAEKFAANFVLGLIAPYDVQRAAKAMDEDSHGNPIKRKASTFGQQIESGIPVLRERLKKN